ncbi:hypothetical protein AGMMS50268_23820 [Spirochaetia bacterium]|nr:hypothetical protein AGMMS50268_23820 [Spirochaetia bacterium]
MIRPPPVLLDIGANVGAFSFIFSTAGWKVFGIEGSHDNSESLRLTAKINDFDFTLGEFVVSDKTGSIYFFQNGPWGYASHKKPDSTFDKMPSFCLDDYKQTSLTSIEKIDFLKMDIEGSEPAAVRGGKKFLEQFGFPPVFCEVNIFTLFLTNSSKEDLFLEFSSIGYIPFIFDNKKLYKYDHRIFRNEIVTDYLFIHESDNRFDQYKRDDFNESKNDRVIIKTIMDSLYVKDVTLLIAACINVSTSKFGEIPEIKNRVQEIKALPQYIAAIEQFKKNTT